MYLTYAFVCQMCTRTRVFRVRLMGAEAEAVGRRCERMVSKTILAWCQNWLLGDGRARIEADPG